jgi:hypothetical protein
MKTLFDDDEMLRADLPGGEDNDAGPGAGADTSAEDDEYIDVDEGEDEEIDEQEAIECDNAKGNEDDEGLNENEELQTAGARDTARGYAQKSADSDNHIARPLIEGI